LTVSIADSIQFFPEIYIKLSLKDSTVVTKIHYTEYSPHISLKESLKDSPKISPKESLEDFLVWSTSPWFSFLSPKREVLEIPQTSFLEIPLEKEYLLNTYINPLFPENSQLILDYLTMVGKIPQQQQQPPPPPPPRVFNKFVARYDPLNLPTNLHDFLDNYLKLLPRFNGEDETTTLKHLATFDYFIDNQNSWKYM